jgi:hypothetical protein
VRPYAGFHCPVCSSQMFNAEGQTSSCLCGTDKKNWHEGSLEQCLECRREQPVSPHQSLIALAERAVAALERIADAVDTQALLNFNPGINLTREAIVEASGELGQRILRRLAPKTFKKADEAALKKSEQKPTP